MFDEPTQPPPEPTELQPKITVDWDALPLNDLIDYRTQINNALSRRAPMSLVDLNVETELLLQFSVLTRLQSTIIDSEEVPVNQKASVAGAVGTILTRIADRQDSVHRSERFKEVEHALIRWLMALDTEKAAQLLDQYTEIIRKYEK